MPMTQDACLFRSLEIVLGETGLLLAVGHVFLGILEAVHEKGLLFVVTLALPDLPWVDRFWHPIP